MASWFSVVARVLRTDRIPNSTLQSARCEFEEGDIGTRPGTGMLRNIDVSYFGDRLQSGRSYVIYGGIRLPPNDNHIDLPKVSPLYLDFYIPDTADRAAFSQMTAQHVIPYLGDILPVHRLRICGAADLLGVPTINKDTSEEAWEFEVSMTGYYSDPIDDVSRKKDLRASMTHTTNQTCFAATHQAIFKSVLGSQSLRPARSKFFIEGEYTFAFAPTENGSCIELTYIQYNSTNRGGAPPLESPQPSGDSARRRNVKKKENLPPSTSPAKLAPTTPQNNRSNRQYGSSMASSSATPYASTSVHETPSTADTDGHPPIQPVYRFDDFVDIDDIMPTALDTVSPSEFRKGKGKAKRTTAQAADDDEDIVEVARRTKRQRKPTAKAAALQLVVDEAEVVGIDDLYEDGGDSDLPGF